MGGGRQRVPRDGAAVAAWCPLSLGRFLRQTLAPGAKDAPEFPTTELQYGGVELACLGRALADGLVARANPRAGRASDFPSTGASDGNRAAFHASAAWRRGPPRPRASATNA